MARTIEENKFMTRMYKFAKNETCRDWRDWRDCRDWRDGVAGGIGTGGETA
jgi:hypothetical protein